jgi:hypothetical protein
MSGMFSSDHQFDMQLVGLREVFLERRETVDEVLCQDLGGSSSGYHWGFTTAAKLLTQRRVESGIAIAAAVFVAM